MEALIIENPKIFVYLDNNFQCFKEPAEGLIPYETNFFFGREELIPFYRIVPEHSYWIHPNGTIFYGEMIAPIGS